MATQAYRNIMRAARIAFQGTACRSCGTASAAAAILTERRRCPYPVRGEEPDPRRLLAQREAGRDRAGGYRSDSAR